MQEMSEEEVLQEAKNMTRRLSKGAADGSDSDEDAGIDTGNSSKTPRQDSDNASPATVEVLAGVQIRKPSDRAQAAENEGQSAAPKMSENAKLLQQTRLFGRVADQALIELAARGEERVYRPGDVVYREGDKVAQNWMGVVLSGHLVNSLAESYLTTAEAGAPLTSALPNLTAGTLFGELACLEVREMRTSTLTAEGEAKVLVLNGDAIWAAMQGFPDDIERLIVDIDCWRSFMSARFASVCHPEIMYQLRSSATLRRLLPGEELVLGGLGTVEDTKRQPRCSAVIESGIARNVATEQDLKESDIACETSMLGIGGSVTIKNVAPDENACQIALIHRMTFWTFISNFPKEKEAFTRMALERLPPATSEISHMPLLAQLEGSSSFFRAIAGCVKQQVVTPGSAIVKAKDARDALSFLQQGRADVIYHGHKIRELLVGSSSGELNFLGVQNHSPATIIATEFCILQELKKKDMEAQLTRHHHPRSRWREIIKAKHTFKQESQVDRQLRMLSESSFFGDELPPEFMKDVHKLMEAIIYFPGQKILDRDGPDGTMFLIAEGTVDRLVPGKGPRSEGPGTLVGAISLLCTPVGPREVLTATSTCCVLALHRMLLIDALKRHPQVKRHFEAVAKAYMKQHNEESVKEDSANIYSMPFFKDCGSRFLYLLDLHLERHIFFSDEVIVMENTEGEEMYILYSGVMDVKVKGVTVGQLEGGMCFGEMAVLGLVKKRSATIVAKSLCDVRILSKKSLDEAIKEFPEELSRFEGLAATRNRVSLEKRNGGQVRHLCHLFQDCRPEFALAIANKMQDRLFRAGQVMMRENEHGDSMMLLHQGEAVVTVNNEEVAKLRDGDICGELAVLGMSPLRTATITASETCFAQELHRDVLLPLLEQTEYQAERQALRQLSAQRMEWKYVPDTIRSFDIFHGSPKAFTDLIDQKHKRYIFFCGDEMITKGSPCSYLMMICRGSVEVLDDSGNVTGEIGEGSVIGELGALELVDKRSATVRCNDICDVYIITKPNLLKCLLQFPDQEARFRMLGTQRMRNDVERVSEKNVLLNCPLFQQSSRKFLDRIAAHLEDRLYRRGEDLCLQGEKGDTMFILVQGSCDVIVKVEDQEKIVSELSTGSIIGEIAVLGLSEVRTATLRAKTVCLVQVLHRSILMKYLTEFPREITQFQEVGAARLAKSGIKNKDIYPKQAWFKDGAPDFLADLGKVLQRKIFFPQQIILAEGTETSDMYVIAQGVASCMQKKHMIGQIQEGEAFGELAVLRIMMQQTMTIKAEQMVDAQSLSSSDLETLLMTYPGEKDRILEIVAANMREELADLSNRDVIEEVPLFAELGEDFWDSLSKVVQVKLARKDELIKGKDEIVFFVIMQGSACVELGGLATRELAEGDNYGEPESLGLEEEDHQSNLEVRVNSSVCLFLLASKQDVQQALAKTPDGHKIRDTLAGTIEVFPGLREKALERNHILAHFRMDEDQLIRLESWCEEIAFAAGQEVLSSAQRQRNMLFILAGKASCRAGRQELVLEPGSSLGDLNMDGIAVGRPSVVTAQTNCKALLMNKHAFLEFIKGEPADESARLVAALDTIPREKHSQADARGPATLRQIADRFCEQCLVEAKAGLKAKVKPWYAPKGKSTKLGKGGLRSGGLKPKSTGKVMIGVGDDKSDDDIETDDLMERKRRQSYAIMRSRRTSVSAVVATAKQMGEASAKARGTMAIISEGEHLRSLLAGTPIPEQKPPPPPKLTDLDIQEQNFCFDMRRLAKYAEETLKDARKEQARLKQQAIKLRTDLRNQKKGPAKGKQRVLFGQEGLTYEEAQKVQVLESCIKSAKKRVAEKTKTVEQLQAQRQALLVKLLGEEEVNILSNAKSSKSKKDEEDEEEFPAAPVPTRTTRGSVFSGKMTLSYNMDDEDDEED